MTEPHRKDNRSVADKVASRMRRLLRDNPLARSWIGRRRRRILTDEFIGSEDYEKMMLTHYEPGRDGPDSAELKTANFRYRHWSKNELLGAWRWLGLFERREVIRPYVFDERLSGVDVGGARGPISLSVDICDRLDVDIFGRPVRFHDLDEIENDSLDYVWSSHTFEHLPSLDAFIERLGEKLKSGGRLFALVPAHTCRRWRAGAHHYEDVKGDSSHLYTFYLQSSPPSDADESFLAIDALVARFLRLEEAAMVGDNSIFIHALRS